VINSETVPCLIYTINTKASATVRFVSPNVLQFIRFHSCCTEGSVTLQHCRLDCLTFEALISDCV